ncbi:hypothetical protein [Poseidonibacter lekithochrous]|uniref:hypothetical protein n=1 Tax=Poseidonibacter lekithochrous TaxID=1904463 RepID=UPI000D3C9484|nr:hypothetical protein [Poseidonibacter lekithochrous]
MEINLVEVIGTSIGLSVLIISGLLFIFKTVIKEFFTNSIKHDYDIKLEVLKSELTQNENDLKALRESALEGVSKRQSILYKKQIQSVEILWKDVIILSKYKYISSLINSLNFEKASVLAEKDTKIRDTFKMIEGEYNIKTVDFFAGENVKPFISELGWAYYKAYKLIIQNDMLKFEILKIGLNEESLYNNKTLENLLIATIPEKKDLIINKTITSHYLFEILEEKLLRELKKFLKGEENNKESIELASKIMKEVDKIQKEIIDTQ